MGSNRRQQTINKRNRERAVAEKRALKLQRKQEKREAARNGEPWPPEQPSLEPEGDTARLDGETAPLDGETARVDGEIAP